MDQLDFFVGVDWSSADHQVCVVDMKGKVCAQRSFKHCGMGLTEMADWIVRTTQSAPHKVGVAIETPRGPVVESLMGREFVVYSINPKQLDRYRIVSAWQVPRTIVSMRVCWPKPCDWTAITCDVWMRRCPKW